jgi:hypothetical protein
MREFVNVYIWVLITDCRKICKFIKGKFVKKHIVVENSKVL